MKEVHNFIFILFKKTIWKIFLKKSPKCFKIKVYLFIKKKKKVSSSSYLIKKILDSLFNRKTF